MLLCGIINELEKQQAQNGGNVVYFFFQATESRINTAMAALRSLIFLLLEQQPSLLSYVQKEYDQAGDALFGDGNPWFALQDILEQMLRDPCLQDTYLIIDALDECVTDLEPLLSMLSQSSARFPMVKWIVSSRNWPGIEADIGSAKNHLELRLELNEDSVSNAIAAYIDSNVNYITERNRYNAKIRDVIYRYLTSNAQGTFLWVALVCKALGKTRPEKVEKKLQTFPPGLDEFYRRMMDHIYHQDDMDDITQCKRVLAVVSLIYQPTTTTELASLLDINCGIYYDSLPQIIGLCGSFINLRDGIISFVHQSAQDFLLNKAAQELFPAGKADAHYAIFSQSLRIMSQTLRRDIYNLRDPGIPIELVRRPEPDPLQTVQYSCVYWVEHLHASAPVGYVPRQIGDNNLMEAFLRNSYLQWLEALSILRNVPQGVRAIIKLESLVQGQTSQLMNLVHDGRRFIQHFKGAVEQSPLQVYVSGLIFSPTHSITRSLAVRNEPKWIDVKPAVKENRDACLQTLEGHNSTVNSVTFSPDSRHIVSGSGDNTAKVWDAQNGASLQTLEGHSSMVSSVAFSPDGQHIVSGSRDTTVKVWEVQNGACFQTLEGCVYSDLSLLSEVMSNLKTWEITQNWITWNTKKMIWIPSDYRPTCFVSSSDAIVVGCYSGFIWTISFNMELLPIE